MGRWTSPGVEEEPGRWTRTGEEREDKAEQEGGEEANRGDKVWGDRKSSSMMTRDEEGGLSRRRSRTGK